MVKKPGGTPPPGLDILIWAVAPDQTDQVREDLYG